MSGILILSQASLESSTDYLCKWLLYYKIPFLRFNGEDLFALNSLVEIPDDQEFSIAWYRRRVAQFTDVDLTFKQDNHEANTAVKKFLNDEFKALHAYIFHKISLKKWINNPFTVTTLNKLQVLKLAEKHGLTIPFTEMVTSRIAVAALLEKYEQLIVKPFSEVIFFDTIDGDHFNMLTKVVNAKNIRYVPERFFPSLVQQHIVKKMELRIFYLFGKFYSMAIYSQNNKKTQDDFRNYDHVRPNRTVPYQLPIGIELQLRALMEDLEFQTGSIDMILTPSGEYIFLEINPEGQFGMVSYPCNYYLEKEMALRFKDKISEEIDLDLSKHSNEVAYQDDPSFKFR
ncbi:hypothetical protein SF1_02710 [Sphingobacterium faecium NBRC 15299]|uniref:grasp-with-spasm system ATP-grasp peptide maturase n=1 Tax=Sphingobacterium faecium TaxID=34087 RepID=UPI000D3BA2EA|nr:grasp-with-spasm system ATP-grasp peptide maturase [Sphingobacterium faecium]PTX12582.1 ATP-GRASP peptide maturase of grasp-with-spasm system [Sphingobacterium faecium]GEM62289.1 hypothetical protein SF1_02710 [Sphingobacterium faecium NBRC 15299]